MAEFPDQNDAFWRNLLAETIACMSSKQLRQVKDIVKNEVLASEQEKATLLSAIDTVIDLKSYAAGEDSTG